MKYFLVGYMASGKTRRGKVMAEREGLAFIDLDDYIVGCERRSIAEIFAEMGEMGFRELEFRYLHEVCEKYDDFVLSTGGGTPCFFGNMEYMNEQGCTIFLNTRVDVIVERLIKGKHKRPIVCGLKDGEVFDFVNKHLEARMGFYRMAQEVISE